MNTHPNTALTDVVLVGHCGFDGSSIRRLVERVLPEADVTIANSRDDLEPKLHGKSLLLINRVLDGRFAAGSSFELIKQLTNSDDPPRMMLVSNFEDAQEQAIAAGALRGFGKNDLALPEAADRLKQAASGSPATA